MRILDIVSVIILILVAVLGVLYWQVKRSKKYEDLEVRLNPMGTVIHGDIDRAFEAIRACQESVFKNGADRVYSVIKIDDRRDKSASLDQKIKSVEDKM